MKHLFISIIFIVCFCLWSGEKRIAAQEERTYESMMIGTAFRGKAVQRESKRNADGTYTDTYHDTEGNPISETERYFLDGSVKTTQYMMDADLISRSRGMTEPVSLMLHYGVNPEFQAITGITAEQIGKFNLSLWDMQEYPPDDVIDILVQAGKTNDAAELEILAQKFIDHVIDIGDHLWDQLSKTVTPEQMLKLRELELQMPSTTIGLNDFYVNFGAYDGLELTEEQKNQLKTLQKEYIKDQKEFVKTMRSGKDRKEASGKLKKITELVKDKIKALLTETQKAKLTQLLANRPNWLVSNVSSASEKPAADTSWRDSWKPGDPLPEGAIPPAPKKHFPLHE